MVGQAGDQESELVQFREGQLDVALCGNLAASWIELRLLEGDDFRQTELFRRAPRREHRAQGGGEQPSLSASGRPGD